MSAACAVRSSASFSSALPSPPSLVITIHRQPREDHDRHRMPGQPLHHTSRGIFGINAADGQTVEADHFAVQATNIGLCAVGLLIDQSMALQELIERRLPTVERLHRVRSR